jgi:hypothetical protein
VGTRLKERCGAEDMVATVYGGTGKLHRGGSQWL